jgi:hypothetical protein
MKSKNLLLNMTIFKKIQGEMLNWSSKKANKDIDSREMAIAHSKERNIAPCSTDKV